MNFTNIEKDGKSFLAVRTGLKTKALKGVNISQLQSLPGIIIGREEAEPWPLMGFTEIEGESFFYGPAIDGSVLSETESDEKGTLELVSAFIKLKDSNYPLESFTPDSIFRTNDDRLLFFPPLLMNFLGECSTEKYSLNMLYPYNHPKLTGDAAWAFTVAAFLYKAVSGHHAFSGKYKEEIHRLMIKKSWASLLTEKPGLKSKIIDVINESFSGRATLADWQQILSGLNNSGLFDESLSQEQEAAILANAVKKEKSRLRKLSRQIFLRNHRIKLAAGTVVLIMLASATINTVSNALAPPATIGMNKTEVIETFYNCYNTLDFMLMQDCITSDAGKTDLDQISNMSVISKARTAYEGTTGILEAETWKAAGQLPVKPEIQVWGLTDLIITELSPDRYIIEYEKWIPGSKDEPDTSEESALIMPTGLLVRDTVHLSVVKDAWIIDSLERTSIELQ